MKCYLGRRHYLRYRLLLRSVYLFLVLLCLFSGDALRDILIFLDYLGLYLSFPQTFVPHAFPVARISMIFFLLLFLPLFSLPLPLLLFNVSLSESNGSTEDIILLLELLRDFNRLNGWQWKDWM